MNLSEMCSPKNMNFETHLNLSRSLLHERKFQCAHTSSGVHPPFEDRRVGPPVRLPIKKHMQVRAQAAFVRNLIM